MTIPLNAVKTYAVHLLREDSQLRFDALEMIVDSKDGLLKFFGTAQKLLYLIPVTSVRFIRVTDPVPQPEGIDF